MSARILTYRSANADPDKQWLALVDTSREGTIWVTFTGPTEEAVKERVRAFWTREKEKALLRRGPRKTLEAAHAA
jgi:hypothetical protein